MAWPWPCGSNVSAALIDHVNNLKLQYLVELSKLGDSCAGLEQRVEAWLNEHDVVFAGQTIPFVLMPHFISPGQLRRVKHAVSTPAWFDRDKAGFTSPALDESVLGLLTALMVPLQILLIAFAMSGFRQAWNVEVEHPLDEPPDRGRHDEGDREERPERGNASPAPA